MFLATDVYYIDDGSALAAGVVFSDFRSGKSVAEYAVPVLGVLPYEPGSFYKRELPCLMALLSQVEQAIDVVIVDGYVDMMPEHPGLGRHLYDVLGRTVTVIGIAKTHFAGTTAAVVVRGESKSPLYVTTAGMEIGVAVELVQSMHGGYRIPTILGRVDALSRGRK